MSLLLFVNTLRSTPSTSVISLFPILSSAFHRQRSAWQALCLPRAPLCVLLALCCERCQEGLFVNPAVYVACVRSKLMFLKEKRDFVDSSVGRVRGVDH